MQVVLINPTPPDISAFGVRSLSAYLRHYGHETRVIFLPGSIGLLEEGGTFVYTYPPEILEQLLDLCEDADLIGVSFMTNYFDRAFQITRLLKKHLKTPVIWGGIHPSTKPDEALEHADMVCIGEGEEPLLEILECLKNQKDWLTVRGVWCRKEGQIIRNELRPLIPDLDTLPFFDFSNQQHFIHRKESSRIEPLTDDLFHEILPLLPGRKGWLRKTIRIMTDRGCPHLCAYCNVATLKKMYEHDKSPYLRTRSVENVIRELQLLKDRFPSLEAIQIFDDTFFARPLKYIEQFSALYKARIGLPLYCQASPGTLRKNKLDLLLDAGLEYVEMGIQTGSPRIRELYRRKESNEQILAAAKLLNARKNRLIPPDYHLILDNPWETDEDVFDTVKLLYQIPKPYGLCIASLVFFPGTALYDKAKDEGLIQDEVAEIYRKPFYIPPKKTYLNFLIYLFTFQHIPRSLLKLLMRENVVKTLTPRNLSLLYSLAYITGETCRLFVKGVKAVFHGDWRRFLLFGKRLMLRDPVSAGRKK